MCQCTKEDGCPCCRWLGALSEEERRVDLVTAMQDRIDRLSPQELEQAKEKYRQKWEK